MLPPDLKEWDEATQSSYNLEKVILESDDSIIKLFSPTKNAKFYCNAPYFYDGGMVLKDNILTEKIYNKLLKFIDNEGLKYVLLKSRVALDIEKKENIKIDDDYYTFTLNLDGGEEQIWKNKLKSTTRNQVRKAQKQEFEIRIGHLDLLTDYYSVITQGWRDLGTPTHSQKFYFSILNNMINNSGIMVIYQNGKPISCALLIMVDKVIYHPYSCSLKEYKSTCVNNLLYWEIIKYGCSKGCTLFDMGRSRVGQGTFKYKKSWGAEPIQLFYIYLLNRGVIMPTFDKAFYKYATSIWKKLPLKIANTLGPIFIKNIL